MASTYPTTLDAFSTAKQDDTDSKSGADLGVSTTTGDHAQHHNDLADAVNKVEAELGLLPKGTFATVRARLDARTTVRKSADQTFSSSVTPANVTDLVFPVVAGNDYYFKFVVVYNSALVTNGVRLALTCPALTGYISAKVEIQGRAAFTSGTQGAATTNLSEFTGFITASGGVVASDAVAVINVNYVAIIEGVLSNPSASGNLQVQAANEVSTASGNVIKKGSYGELYIN